ncbi:hypothetical protein GOODEAATRI_009088 [Goodea atripinnis]|uniref:Uncharacterized protein n=1 Tax=Goodea atripinnis TaxID=208336 RepID=A0ABV0NT27_9TELE
MGTYQCYMPKASSVKQCEIFWRRHKISVRTTTSTPAWGTEAKMATTAKVLEELKLLRSDFGAKLDRIDGRLTGIPNAVAALERKVSEVKQDQLNQAAHMEEAEARIAM